MKVNIHYSPKDTLEIRVYNILFDVHVFKDILIGVIKSYELFKFGENLQQTIAGVSL